MQQNKVGEVKLLMQFGRFSFIILLMICALNAQSFKDFKTSQTQSFGNYKELKDKEFKKNLTGQWRAYNVYRGVKLYEKPKPKSIVSAKTIKTKSIGPIVNVKIIPEKKVLVDAVVFKKDKDFVTLDKKAPSFDTKVDNLIVIKEKDGNILLKSDLKSKTSLVKKDINFNFFGSELGFNISANLKKSKFYPKNQKGIVNFFDTAASSEYEGLIDDIKSVSKDLGLNDWGIYLLVQNISKKAFTNSDDKKLFSWFIFNKLGYAVKIGLSNKHIVLMHYSKKTIYSTPSYSFLNKKYYVISHYAKRNIRSLYSYKQDYPDATKAMDLSLDKLPNFVKDMQNKTLKFKEFGNSYAVSFKYNKNIIDFMATYPQADYETFFNAPIEKETYKDIASDLKKYIDGKRASDAINFVLHFVQNSFIYETDQQQFAREKVMFAQETLFYNKSDCEDRAVLFSYLMKELFSIGVIGVKYKDHMATALNIPMQGDAIKAGSKRFIIADPTYINASVGQSMPKYKPIKPESFIVVRK